MILAARAPVLWAIPSTMPHHVGKVVLLLLLRLNAPTFFLGLTSLLLCPKSLFLPPRTSSLLFLSRTSFSFFPDPPLHCFPPEPFFLVCPLLFRQQSRRCVAYTQYTIAHDHFIHKLVRSCSWVLCVRAQERTPYTYIYMSGLVKIRK